MMVVVVVMMMKQFRLSTRAEVDCCKVALKKVQLEKLLAAVREGCPEALDQQVWKSHSNGLDAHS